MQASSGKHAHVISAPLEQHDPAWSVRVAIAGGRVRLDQLGTELVVDETYRRSSIGTSPA